MTIKEDVFQFIEKNPEMSLDQIVDGLSHLKKASVRKYYYDYRKLKDGEVKTRKRSKKKGTAGGGSIRQQVYDLLEQNPTATIDEICSAITDCNRKTIRDYRNRWRSTNAKALQQAASADDNKEGGKLKEAVYNFMRQNPEANLNDLKKRFPDYKKLVTDFRSWKLEQSNKLRSARKSAEEAVSGHLSVDSYKKTIDSLKQVIEKQKTTIESQRQKLKQVRTQLAQTPKFNLDGLKTFIANKLLKK